MVQVQAREAGDAVHGVCKPHRAREICRAAPGGDAGRRLCGQALAAHMACKPAPPAGGKHAPRSKTRDALEPRQRERIRSTFLGKIKVRDHDDEVVHERVF